MTLPLYARLATSSPTEVPFHTSRTGDVGSGCTLPALYSRLPVKGPGKPDAAVTNRSTAQAVATRRCKTSIACRPCSWGTCAACWAVAARFRLCAWASTGPRRRKTQHRSASPLQSGGRRCALPPGHAACAGRGGDGAAAAAPPRRHVTSPPPAGCACASPRSQHERRSPARAWLGVSSCPGLHHVMVQSSLAPAGLRGGLSAPRSEVGRDLLSQSVAPSR